MRGRSSSPRTDRDDHRRAGDRRTRAGAPTRRTPHRAVGPAVPVAVDRRVRRLHRVAAGVEPLSVAHRLRRHQFAPIRRLRQLRRAVRLLEGRARARQHRVLHTRSSPAVRRDLPGARTAPPTGGAQRRLLPDHFLPAEDDAARRRPHPVPAFVNGQNGLINSALRTVGIDGPAWTTNPSWVKPGLVIMSLWAVGASVIILLGTARSIGRGTQ